MTVTDKKLEWVITEYGKRRITELLKPENENKIRISFMNIGSDSSGSPKDREGKNPENGDGHLFNQVNVKNIPIFEKGIAQDRENTIYFKAIIDENMCGYDIAELAIFEEVNGVEKMFAVGVGQPIAKPHIKNGYLMSIEYTLYIESINLLEIYDKIELDPKNEFLKEADIDSLYRTILYVEGNLAEQINNNSRLIGRGRAQELNSLIDNTKLNYNAASVSTYYSSLANSVTDLNNIIGFWSFHYTDSYGLKSNIKDFSLFDNYLSTNSLLSSYNQDYLGVLSALNFKGNDFYYLDSVVKAYVNTRNIELGRLKDYMLQGEAIYATDNNAWAIGSTLYDEKTFKEEIIEYYLKAQTVETDSETISIDIHPEFLDIEQQIPNPLAGKPLFGSLAYAPHTWTFNAETNIWKNEINKEYDILEFKTNVVSYTGEAVDKDTISLHTTLKPDRNETIKFTGKQFDLIQYVKNEFEDKYDVKDVPFTFIVALKHNSLGKRNTILAQSDYFSGHHNFEIIKTEDNAIELKLFSGIDSKFISFKTNKNIVPSSAYSLIITYNPHYDHLGRLNPIVRIVLNGKSYDVTVIDNNYDGMVENIMETTSYILKLDENNMNAKTYNVDSQICLMALIREELTLQNIRCNSLILNSLCGKNVYFRI